MAHGDSSGMIILILIAAFALLLAITLAIQAAKRREAWRNLAARRFYNSNVRANNVLVCSVPSNIVAAWFGFREEEYFEIEEAGVREPVEVSLT